MSNILEIDFSIPESEVFEINKFMEKTSEIIEPEMCIAENTQIDEGVICYI